MSEHSALPAPARTTKNFMIEIGTIAIGLLLGLGLQQVAESVHNASQREEIERRIEQTLKTNLEINAANFDEFREFRAYLTELRTAISARLRGEPAPAQPPARDLRMRTFIIYPGIAPYDAAKQNGTVALLDENRIRLYNRFSLALGIMHESRQAWMAQAIEMEAFQKRYVDSRGSMVQNAESAAPNIALLSESALAEYLRLVALMIAQTDSLASRMDLIDQEIRVILAGTTDETALIRDAVKARPDGFGVNVDAD